MIEFLKVNKAYILINLQKSPNCRDKMIISLKYFTSLLSFPENGKPNGYIIYTC